MLGCFCSISDLRLVLNIYWTKVNNIALNCFYNAYYDHTVSLQLIVLKESPHFLEAFL